MPELPSSDKSDRVSQLTGIGVDLGPVEPCLYPKAFDDVRHQFRLSLRRIQVIGHVLGWLTYVVDKGKHNDVEAWRVILCAILEGLFLGDKYSELGRDIRLEAAKGEGVTIQLEAGFQQGCEGTSASGVCLMVGISQAEWHNQVGVRTVSLG